MKLDQLPYRTRKARTGKPVTPRQAAAHLAQAAEASDSFLEFMRFLHPDWEIPTFHRRFAEVLDLLEARDLSIEYNPYETTPERRNPSGTPRCYNLMVNMPPRHAKTTYGTINFPVWCIGRDPTMKGIIASYNQPLALDFGGQARDITNDKLFRRVFPGWEPHPRYQSNEYWGTTAGGRNAYVGIGGTLTGRGANLILLDDPIKSRVEAESELMRNNVWNYYISSLLTRLEPDAYGRHPILIVTQTRWHPDDICGRIQKLDEYKSEWVHINFPGLSEEGKALWPARFPADMLRKFKEKDEREFEALVQQNPTLEEGNLIKVNNFKRKAVGDMTSIVITVDPAATKETYSDDSGLLIGGVDTEGDIVLIKMINERMEFPELKAMMRTLNAMWRGKGLSAFYVENKSAGHSLVQELRRESGIAVVLYKLEQRSDKVARMIPGLPLIDGGMVYLNEDEDWTEFLEQTRAFPNGSADECVDCLSMMLQILSKQTIPLGGPTMGVQTMEQIMKRYERAPSLADMDGRKWKGWGQ